MARQQAERAEFRWHRGTYIVRDIVSGTTQTAFPPGDDNDRPKLAITRLMCYSLRS